jgi:hypothetical protein
MAIDPHPIQPRMTQKKFRSGVRETTSFGLLESSCSAGGEAECIAQLQDKEQKNKVEKNGEAGIYN